MNKITIELVQEERGGGPCVCVRVRMDELVVETPWLIGGGVEAAKSVASRLSTRYPHVSQTRVGF